MTKSVSIIGSGPAGLLAAHAADTLGWDFRILSQVKKSNLLGCQYLRNAVPGMTEEKPIVINCHLEGTPEEYRTKMYGSDTTGVKDNENYEDNRYAWDLRTAYDKLWIAYGKELRYWFVQPDDLDLLRGTDVVISTVPRPTWAEPGDVFNSYTIWVACDEPYEGIPAPFRPEPSTIIRDGTSDVGWYKASNVFGHSAVEWPEATKPPLTRLHKVTRPLGHNSTAASDIHHLGSYGAWDRSELASNVYEQALKVLAEDRI